MLNFVKCFIYFSDANILPKDVKSIGISTQRATFTTWKKSTGKPFHNLITWKDLRADALVKEWNNSFSMKVSIHVHTGASIKGGGGSFRKLLTPLTYVL